MIVEPELADHPDFLLLKARIGDVAMEVLIRLWGHCQSNRRGERWRGRSAAYVEAVARWAGQPGELYRALVTLGWVEADDGGVSIHNWAKMNAKLLASRSNGSNGGRPTKHGGNSSSELQPKPNNDLNKTGSSKHQTGESTDNQQPTDNPHLTQPEGKRNPTETRPSGLSGPSTPSQSGGGLPPPDDHALASSLIRLLNELTGAKFDPPLVELDGVVRRVLEVNREMAGIEKMLRRQVKLWSHDLHMRQWLKPSTLFGDKFHDYYGQRDQPADMASPGKYQKHGGLSERTELLQQLAASQQLLDQEPPDSPERSAIQIEIKALKARLA